ncbi:MAG: ATP-binding cassette domain-containing protein [Rhodospirillales bacterium]|nr:ATP-binding cassette domain-containing protein [Rhodospirillales bacterium]
MVRLRDVRFRWRTRDPLVLDIRALDVGDGERVFIEGPSGSGKTSLLNLLGGVMVPEAGSIAIQDTEITALPGARRDAFRADRVGFIFQMFNLVPYLSLIDNVVLPCLFSSGRRARAVGRGGTLEGEARRILGHLELDADELATRSVTRLSIGQQQRVAAARALIGAPPLVIADEPTSSLDANVRRRFLELLFHEVAEAGSTLLFVSHDTRLEEGFDRSIALMDINGAGDLS